MIVYDKIVRGNTTHYGLKGTYKCLPPNVLIGDARAACTASGNWTKTPECRGIRARKAEASVIVPVLVYFTFKEAPAMVSSEIRFHGILNVLKQLKSKS